MSDTPVPLPDPFADERAMFDRLFDSTADTALELAEWVTDQFLGDPHLTPVRHLVAGARDALHAAVTLLNEARLSLPPLLPEPPDPDVERARAILANASSPIHEADRSLLSRTEIAESLIISGLTAFDIVGLDTPTDRLAPALRRLATGLHLLDTDRD